MNMAPWLFFVSASLMWLALIGRAGWLDLAQGLPVVLSAWWLFRRATRGGHSGPGPDWVLKAARFLVLHVVPDMVRSTARVVGKVLEPRISVSPAIVRVPLPDGAPEDLILFAYSIALTPGQQIIAVDEQPRVLYVHITDAPDPDAERLAILAIYDRYLRRT
jgi:multisubunit Na+/H+ antiporter MnhE subunit